MPYLAADQEEEFRKQQQQNQTGGGINISGQGGIINNDSGTAPKGPQESGSFTNLNQYLDANKTQAASMGAKIATDVTNEGVKSTEGINNFRQTAAPEVKAFDPSGTYQNITTLQDSDKEAYKTAKAGYQGPQAASEVEGWGDLQKNVSKVNTQANQAANDVGRQSLLQETYKRPQYTQGQKQLDSMLISRSPESKQQLEKVHQDFGGIQKMLDDASSEVNGRITNNIQTGYANQQAIAAGDASAKQNLLSPIQQRAQSANQAAPDLVSQYQNSLKANSLSAEQMQRLGLTENQNIYDMDLSAYFRPDMTKVNMDNVATADERAQYAALTALLDGQAGQDITANGKQIDPIGFDKKAFDTDQTAKDTEYKDAYANQRGTSLNSRYLPNPNAANGYAAYVPGQYNTEGRDITNASPSEIENYWLPLFKRADQETGYHIYGQTADALQKSLNDWKANYKPERTIKRTG